MAVEASRLILVVEDDDDVRQFAVNVLRERGYDVIEAVNGGVALVLLEQDLPIELLFTDIVMPGEPDGVALAERAKELRPNLQVLYTTGFAGASRFHRHAVHGKVLGKPYRSRQLTSEIEQLLAAGAGSVNSGKPAPAFTTVPRRFPS